MPRSHVPKVPKPKGGFSPLPFTSSKCQMAPSTSKGVKTNNEKAAKAVGSQKKQKSVTEEVLSRLTNLEQIIDKMFALRSISQLCEGLLERKISQLEEMIVELPEEAEELADDWRLKVVQLLQKLYVQNVYNKEENQDLGPEKFGLSGNVPKAEVMKEEVLEIEPKEDGEIELKEEAEIEPEKEEAEIEPKENGEIEPEKKEASTSKDVSKNNTSSTSPTAVLANQAPVVPNSSSQLVDQDTIRKQNFLGSLERALSNVNDVESSDISSVKRLLKQAALAEQNLTYNPKDFQLHFDVFNLVFHKLSRSLRDQFLNIYSPEAKGPEKFPKSVNLHCLVTFLQAEIVSQHSKTVWLISSKKAQEGDLKINPNGPTYFYNSQMPPERVRPPFTLYCRYCKTSGHTYEFCPAVRDLLCFHCYGHGHTKRNCPAIVFPRHRSF